MKNILIAFLFALVAFTSVKAQTRTLFTSTVQQGQFLDFGGTYYPLNATDSLQVTDSLSYVVNITHTNDISPYLTWFWQKVGTGTATVTVNFFTGNDPSGLFPVKAGLSQTNYSKSYTLSASGYNEVDFARDTARISGRYLKIQFITSSTPSVKGFIANRMKVNIK